MTGRSCPRHHVAMEIVPAEPRARCMSCGYVNHFLEFQRCPECGSQMHIEEPEPQWRCPVCHPVSRAATLVG
jgi:predicted Zn-ribbon and HTH transcriptional regulator